MFFLDVEFKRFCSDFCDFGSILGDPGGSKNCEKIDKIVFGTLFGFLIDFGSNIGAIWEDFGWILE